MEWHQENRPMTSPRIESPRTPKVPGAQCARGLPRNGGGTHCVWILIMLWMTIKHILPYSTATHTHTHIHVYILYRRPGVPPRGLLCDQLLRVYLGLFPVRLGLIYIGCHLYRSRPCKKGTKMSWKPPWMDAGGCLVEFPIISPQPERRLEHQPHFPRQNACFMR